MPKNYLKLCEPLCYSVSSVVKIFLSGGAMRQGEKYQQTLKILQDLEEGDLEEGLFSCFAVSRRGELIYFDEVGTPFGVALEGAIFVKTQPLDLPPQPMKVISTKEAYEKATEQHNSQYLATLIARNYSLKKGGGINLLVILLILAGAGAFYWFVMRTPSEPDISVDLASMKVINVGSYNPIAEPSISFAVFRDFLKEMNSPAYSEAEAMYRACVSEGCDPALVLAFFEHESSGGRAGVAVETKSIGNIRCSNGYTCYTTQGNGSFRKYSSWAEGTKDWAKLLQFYRSSWKLSTLEQIIPVYAPNSDNNNEAAYIAGVKKRVDSLRARELSR